MKILDKAYPFCLPLLLLLTYFIYSPGFSAGFIFDDYRNLNRFADLRSGIEGIWQFLKYSSFNRPLSFLSFMMNDNLWPSTPEIFIKTNILLHLLCASLLTVCFILIGKNLGWTQRKREVIALYAVSAWLIHPLFVSTVLYIVQRMTILSAIFVLLSLISYLHGRLQLINGYKKAWFWLVFATPGFGVLGLLCKENAALIPVYLLAFEVALFSKEKQLTKYYLYWRRYFIYLPVIAMVFSIFIFKSSWILDYYIREFSVMERLLTEANILTLYLFLLFIPRSSTNGLHYENYQISTSLVDPWTTLLAIIFIVGIILFSIFHRKKYPILAFAILFFFAGHLLESTFLALELYFEHRNYLPSMMLFFTLSVGLYQYYGKYRKVVVVIAISIIFTLSSLTYMRSDLWGNQLLLLSMWTEKNPASHRNYISGQLVAHRLHRPDLGGEFLEKGAEALPDNVHIMLGYTGYICVQGTIDESDLEKLNSILKETKKTKTDYIYRNFAQLMDVFLSPQCDFIGYNEIKAFLTSLLENPNITKYRLRVHEIMHLMGRLELESKKYLEAKEAFLQSFQLHMHPEIALQQVAMLGDHNQYELAYDYLLEAKKMLYGEYEIKQHEQSVGWSDFNYIESILLEELNEKSTDK